MQKFVLGFLPIEHPNLGPHLLSALSNFSILSFFLKKIYPFLLLLLFKSHISFHENKDLTKEFFYYYFIYVAQKQTL